MPRLKLSLMLSRAHLLRNIYPIWIDFSKPSAAHLQLSHLASLPLILRYIVEKSHYREWAWVHFVIWKSIRIRKLFSDSISNRIGSVRVRSRWMNIFQFASCRSNPLTLIKPDNGAETKNLLNESIQIRPPLEGALFDGKFRWNLLNPAWFACKPCGFCCRLLARCAKFWRNQSRSSLFIRPAHLYAFKAD